VIETAKERIDVPGGGVNSTAASVRWSVALPLPPPPPPNPFFTPLHEVSPKNAAKAINNVHRLEFMKSIPNGLDHLAVATHEEEAPSGGLCQAAHPNASFRVGASTQLDCMSNVASDLPKGPKGDGLVVFNIQDRIQLRFLHHVLHVLCRAKQLQFALVIPHAR
jgi:hypothetical protein